MSVLKKLPRPVLWILSVFLVFLAVMTFFRFLFFLRFDPAGKPFSGSAFLMGLRFDVKFIGLLGLFMLVLCGIPLFNPFKNAGAKKFWNVLLPVIFLAVVFFYVADYFYYDYLQQRLNASVLNYVNDASISWHMALESYPVFKTLAAMLVITLVAAYGFKKLLAAQLRKTSIGTQKFSAWYIVLFLAFALGFYGKFSQFNLRWSDAFSLTDNFKANLSLNPFQSFFSTISYRDTRPDLAKVKADYPLMARFLGVKNPDSTVLDYNRNFNYPPLAGQKTNVVLVICESFSMYRSSMSGNPFNTTPFFDSLCRNGVFFDRCFTPSYPTARGVWATVTGIPDALGDNNRSASRNPEVVNQRVIMNDFKGYERFYFLGGDPTWANIKGLLLNNIDSLQLYSQDNFKAKKLNVWGIDDKNLFLEANRLLAEQQRPFFAIIQTADNHRPYSIPQEDLGAFKKASYPEDSIHKYGFDNIDQLNAFRYTDFCYQQFFEAARKEKYFANTVFVFVGDHGIGGNAKEMYPLSWTEQRLSAYHVPLLFYGPGIVPPKLVHAPCSQSDIMPSIASLLQVSYQNNSMGRNLFDTGAGAVHSAFIVDHDTKDIGWITDQYYYMQNLKTAKQTLVSVTDNTPVVKSPSTDSTEKAMRQLTEAYYETSRYLLFNNKRKNDARGGIAANPRYFAACINPIPAMLVQWKFPKTIQWVIKLFIIYLAIFSLFRFAIFVFFKPADMPVSSLFRSFWLGLQYDLRWIAFVLLPIACLSLFPKFSPFYSERCKKGWAVYLSLVTLLLLFFFGADFGHFAYINTRLNASALNFAEDAKTSIEMLWQSYPMIWILAGLVGAAAMMTWMFRRTHVSIEERNINIHKFSYRRIWHTATILLLAWFAFGFLSLKPLRWSDAFKLNDNFKSYLALNPLQNFFTTLRFRNPVFSEDKARKHYSVIRDFLQLDKRYTQGDSYERVIHPGANALESKPNIVLVICESFSMYKSSMSGNPLNTTPFFDDLTKKGIFFDRCFSPTFGTARGVFATLTGIPDVQLSKFSTRNLQSLNQYTIVNNFEGYEKMYFIGGSSDFNNFRGLVNNIDDLQIFEEGKFSSPKINVWGISDKSLFMEADKAMKKQKAPFFAIIQTSDNHRPYSIPPEDKDFVPKVIEEDTLRKYGFESVDEYNAFCYTDYCFSRFMDTARRSPYFDNTIFVFVGDHGVEGDAMAVYPKVWTEQRLSDEHVPLLFYAPALLSPQKREETVSQIDVLPTLANMVCQPYTNKTLGRNLLAPGDKKDVAFIIHHDEGKIGVVTDDYYYSKNLWIRQEELLPIRNDLPPLSRQRSDSLKHELSELTSALYETAQWMLVNNHGR